MTRRPQLAITHRPDGWWTIYPPGTPTHSDAPPLYEGPSRWSDIADGWTRPNADDIIHAWQVLQAEERTQ